MFVSTDILHPTHVTLYDPVIRTHQTEIVTMNRCISYTVCREVKQKVLTKLLTTQRLIRNSQFL